MKQRTLTLSFLVLALAAGVTTRMLVESRKPDTALLSLSEGGEPVTSAAEADASVVVDGSEEAERPGEGILLGGEARWESADVAMPVFGYKRMGSEGSWTPRELEGSVWVINFWASWCPPCVKELPALNRAAEALAPHGVQFLAVNAGESEAVIENFVKSTPIAFAVAVGGPKVLGEWQIRGLPTTIVVDPQGRVRAWAVGPREWDDSSIIEELKRFADAFAAG